MPGIVVGIDGSEHARRALEWAMHEAALRQAPLTVLTINQALTGIFTGIAVLSPGDEELARSPGRGRERHAPVRDHHHRDPERGRA